MYIIEDPSMLSAFFTALHGRHERSRREQLPRLFGWGLLGLISLLICGLGLIQWFVWNEPEAWQLVLIMLAVAAVGLGFFLHTHQRMIEFTAIAIVQRSPIPFECWSIPYDSISAVALEQRRHAITALHVATRSRTSRTIPCFSTMQSVCSGYIEEHMSHN